MSIPSDRNSAGNWSMGVYCIGVICAGIGIYLSTTTRINLLTGQTSSPYLGIGIPLVVAGVIAVLVTQQTAKRNLRK
jgi:hypothetical protein